MRPGTAGTPVGGITARSFLYPDHPGPMAARDLGHELHRHGIAASALRQSHHRVSSTSARAADDRVAAAAVNQLEHDLGSMLVDGWRDWWAVMRAARESWEQPGKEKDVVLVSHDVVATRHPRVNLLVDGVPVRTFTFDLTAGFAVSSAEAAFRNGYLVGVRSGRCTVEVTLSLAGHRLARRKHEVTPAALLPLDPPEPIVPEARAWEAEHRPDQHR
ncbi:hypothetical protein [Nocardioides sp. YIM 152588]|uniref:hypothetical protein n=1 Tax=Nocardioides sp. YIM 152588 TaxID=3158259 RepID=UPI0032E424B7